MNAQRVWHSLLNKPAVATITDRITDVQEVQKDSKTE